MSYLTELALGFGRAVSSKLEGASNAVLWSVKFLESLDDPESGESSTAEPPYWGLGIYGRPLPPVAPADATATSPAGECEVLAWKQEDRAYILGARDLRISAKSNPIEGEIGIAQYDGGFISLAPNTDVNGTTITLYAPRNVTPAKASAIVLDSTDGNQQVTLMHESGQSLVMNKDGSVIIIGSTAAGPSVGTTWMSVDETNGIVLSSEKLALAGAVMLGNKDEALGDEVMLSTLLLTWIGEVNAALGVLATHVHGGVLVGGASTGVVAGVTPPAAAPIAATKVKAI